MKKLVLLGLVATMFTVGASAQTLKDDAGDRGKKDRLEHRSQRNGKDFDSHSLTSGDRKDLREGRKDGRNDFRNGGKDFRNGKKDFRNTGKNHHGKFEGRRYGKHHDRHGRKHGRHLSKREQRRFHEMKKHR